jgi:hypothetical protein
MYHDDNQNTGKAKFVMLLLCSITVKHVGQMTRIYAKERRKRVHTK